MPGSRQQIAVTGRAPSRPHAVTLAAPAVLFLASLLLYAVNLDRATFPDELYHILAAKGLLETGEPRIAEGLYTRSYAFTWIVAQSFRLFGESLVTARLPSVVATALLVAVLFLWVRREAGETAAWLAAGLYAISPFAVLIAQFCRFYAVQTLAFTLGLWLVYDLFRDHHGRGGLLWRAVAAMALFGFAAALQPTTLVGLVALAAWAIPVILWRFATGVALSRRTRIAFAAAILFAVLVTLALAHAGGLLEDLWHRYRDVPLFNVENRDAFWFYHAWYVLFYPTLWTVTGILALAAWARVPWPGSFATVVFTAAFLLNSFAGPKSLRYIAYAQPLLFVVWGIGLAALLPALRRSVPWLRDGMAAALAFLGPRRAHTAAGSLVALALLMVVAANPFWLRTATMIADIPVPPEKPTTDWRRAAGALAPLLARVDVVVDTEELGPLYFLGRHDILYSPSKFGELPPGRRHEFGRDVRTGRPVIGSPEALERVFRCYPSGLFLAPESHLGVSHFLNPDVLLLLERYAQPVPLPEDAHVLAWHWQREDGPVPPECRVLPSFLSDVRTP
jgi:4-amino-4-deoxy-L-arabinose transferase-like glycosyltransferase